ncbi:DUF461 domain-containing protein [Streptomyces sp. NPDC050504]|uniref:DUF461 domain-containing protein n=1 Tax=Streptomyces sp. NPDC050504 TaxID=3365618 RepID=UPI003797C5DB
MSRSLRRGALAATAIAISIASLSACGAGNDAQTLGVKPDAAATAVDEIKIQNVTVVTQPKADAAGPAVVTGTIFNNGKEPETLDSISLPGTSATVKLSAAKGKGPIIVPAGGSVAIGGKGNASAVIENGSEAAKNGVAQRVVFQLSKTGNVQLRALVVPATSYFEGVGPTSLPKAPEAKPTSGTAKPSGGASDAASTKPGEGESPAAGGESGKPSDGSTATQGAGH